MTSIGRKVEDSKLNSLYECNIEQCHLTRDSSVKSLGAKTR